MVVKVEGDDIAPVFGKRQREPLRLRADATYFVPGGLGGLGRPLPCSMADKGARYPVTTSRSGGHNFMAQVVVQELSGRGVNIKVFSTDISNESAL